MSHLYNLHLQSKANLVFSNWRFPVLLYWVKQQHWKVKANSQSWAGPTTRTSKAHIHLPIFTPGAQTRSTQEWPAMTFTCRMTATPNFLRWISSYPSRLWQAIFRPGFFLRGHRIHHPCCSTCTLSIQLLSAAFSLPPLPGPVFASQDSQGLTKLNSEKLHQTRLSCREGAGEARSRGWQARLNSALRKPWQCKGITTKSGHVLPNCSTAQGGSQAGLQPENWGRNWGLKTSSIQRTMKTTNPKDNYNQK